MQAKRILLIDDDELSRILFRDAFWIHSPGDNQLDVLAVKSIAEGKELIANPATSPDVIFVGLSLLTKHDNGLSTREIAPSIAFIKEMQASEKWKSIPIIVYTHITETDFKREAKEAGARDYVVKGQLTPKEMVELVEKL